MLERSRDDPNNFPAAKCDQIYAVLLSCDYRKHVAATWRKVSLFLTILPLTQLAASYLQIRLSIKKKNNLAELSNLHFSLKITGWNAASVIMYCSVLICLLQKVVQATVFLYVYEDVNCEVQSTAISGLLVYNPPLSQKLQGERTCISTKLIV